MVDINFATCGTYFNGIMSRDKRVTNLYMELSVVLKAIKARVPDEYYPDLSAQLKAVPAGD